MENWRGSITAVNQCGEHLVQEFPHYESGELKNSMSEVNERWSNITVRYDGRIFLTFVCLKRTISRQDLIEDLWNNHVILIYNEAYMGK